MPTSPLEFESISSVEKKMMTDKIPDPWPEETAESDDEYDLGDDFIDDHDYDEDTVQEESDHVCRCTHPSHQIEDSLGRLWELDEPSSEQPTSEESSSSSDDDDSDDSEEEEEDHAPIHNQEH